MMAANGIGACGRKRSQTTDPPDCVVFGSQAPIAQAQGTEEQRVTPNARVGMQPSAPAPKPPSLPAAAIPPGPRAVQGPRPRPPAA